MFVGFVLLLFCFVCLFLFFVVCLFLCLFVDVFVFWCLYLCACVFVCLFVLFVCLTSTSFTALSLQRIRITPVEFFLNIQ